MSLATVTTRSISREAAFRLIVAAHEHESSRAGRV